MPDLRYVPEFRVEIDGAPIPAALRASITGVTHSTGLEGADRVEVNLVNEGLRWLDNPLVALDKTLKLSVGYAPRPLEQMFVGDIVTHSASFSSGGVPTLTVAAQDRFERLRRGTKVRWFPVPVPRMGNVAMPDVGVASLMSLESGFVPTFDPVGAALSVVLGAAEQPADTGDMDARQKQVRTQDRVTDLVTLQELAKENGWEMFVEHSGPLGGTQLRFMSPLDHLLPDVTLEYGRSLIDFTPRVTTVGQIASVTAHVWVTELKTQFAVTVAWDWDRMALTIDVRPEFVLQRSDESNHVLDEPVTVSTAPRAIIGELIPRLNQRLTGSGSTVGDPRIRAGSVLRLDGLGVEFGGLYRVTSATHSIDSGGYRTSFEVRKEIWFGAIPLPEQGAVPIQVSAPFVS